MLKVEIMTGDIAQIECAALVNAANNHLWMGGGVAGALKRAGGQLIEDEAMRQGPVAVGEVVATGAGSLKAQYVIHAAVMGQDLRTNAEAIRRATVNCLRKAEELGLECVAFPALGTGVGGFPLEECARIMLGAVTEYGKSQTGLNRVMFILRDAAASAVFRRVLIGLTPQ